MGLFARVFTLASGLASVVVAAGLARTLQTQRSPKQNEFLAGRVPSEMPDGFYEGSADFNTDSWKGKSFDQVERRVVNVFDSGGTRRDQFRFRTYIRAGLQDPEIEVLKIDYDIPENPRWLRRVLDEVVEVGDGKLLGKVHARLVPGLPFTLGYFRLEKAAVGVSAESSLNRPIADVVPGEA